MGSRKSRMTLLFVTGLLFKKQFLEENWGVCVMVIQRV